MSATHPIRYVAWITVEAASPFLISRGPEKGRDAVWMADAHGLPTLPGSSIAGVLRSLATDTLGEAAVADLMGWSAGGDDRGRGSRLDVGWGAIHDATGTPVTRLRSPDAVAADPVLRAATAGLLRDHVRINHEGGAAHRGKFDRLVVGPGHRFTFELALAGRPEDREAWDELLALVAGTGFRLGGATRAGYGVFHCVTLREGVFDLATAQGLRDWSALSPGFSGEPALRRRALPAPGGTAVTAVLRLRPEGGWMFGRGPEEDEADLTPVSVAPIVWDERGNGRVGDARLLVPGSGLKGAIAHRAAFHARAELLAGLPEAERAEARAAMMRDPDARPDAAAELFGTMPNDEGTPRAGRVRIGDLLVTAPTVDLPHVSIDRFTGGARDGFLFTERVALNVDLPIVVEVDRSVSPSARRSLRRALEDMAEGRLPVGGGTGRGHGVMTGTIDWGDEQWWGETA